MFEIGDLVEIQYNPDAGVMKGSIVWNLKGSICEIKKVNKDEFGKPYYHLSPINLKIQVEKRYRPSHMNVWWRDELLVPHNDTEYDIDNMSVFQEE